MDSANYPKVTLDEYGIIHIELGSGSTHIDDMKRVNKQHRAISVVPRPVVVYTNAGNSIAIDIDAMSYCSSEDATEVTSAVALVTQSFMQKYLAQVFLTFNRMPCPINIFHDLEDAIAWLKEYAPDEENSAVV